MTTPQNNDPNYDPLQEFDKTPAVSFDPSRGGIAENTWGTMTVTDYIKLVQDKDDNGKPKFYEDSGKPVMKAVLPVEIDGEARALWAKKNYVEGGLFKGLQQAQTALGSRIGPGVELAIKWHWDTTKPKKLGNHPKAYEVKAKAGATPPPADDPLVSTGASARLGSVTVGGSDEPPF
jgi:hypothetical protein